MIEKRFHEEPHDFVAGPVLLDLRNGTIVMIGRGLEGQGSGVVYPGLEAESAPWMDFLGKVFDGDTAEIDRLQLIFGYLLSGLEVIGAGFFAITGPAASGKSIVVGILERMLGEYAIHAVPPAFKNVSTIPNTIASRFKDKRVVILRDWSCGRRCHYSCEGIRYVLNGRQVPLKKNVVWPGDSFHPFVRVVADMQDGVAPEGLENITVTVRLRRAYLGDENWIQNIDQELPGILSWAVRGAVRLFNGERF